MFARGYTDVSIGCNHGIGIEISERKKYTDVEVWLFQLSLVFLKGRANQSRQVCVWRVSEKRGLKGSSKGFGLSDQKGGVAIT